MREAVQEIRGSIQGIDNPAAFRLFRTRLTAFLAKERKLRPRFSENFVDDPLGTPICLTDKVSRAFAGHGQVFDIAKITDQLPTGLVRSLDHYIDERRATHGYFARSM